MKTHTLIRLGGLSAALAGIFRVFTSFEFSFLNGLSLQVAYHTIDILILFGVLGFYLLQHKDLGAFGLAGFVAAMIGSAILIGRGDSQVEYTIAASIFSAGMVLFGFTALFRKVLPPGNAIGLIIFAPTGGLGFFIPSLYFLFIASGLIFGLSFLWMGIHCIRSVR